MTVWRNYVAMHGARKQLAFGTETYNDHVRGVHHRRLDMWWLGLALYLASIEVRCFPSFFKFLLGLTIVFSA